MMAEDGSLSPTSIRWMQSGLSPKRRQEWTPKCDTAIDLRGLDTSDLDFQALASPCRARRRQRKSRASLGAEAAEALQLSESWLDSPRRSLAGRPVELGPEPFGPILRRHSQGAGSALGDTSGILLTSSSAFPDVSAYSPPAPVCEQSSVGPATAASHVVLDVAATPPRRSRTSRRSSMGGDAALQEAMVMSLDAVEMSPPQRGGNSFVSTTAAGESQQMLSCLTTVVESRSAAFQDELEAAEQEQRQEEGDEADAAGNSRQSQCFFIGSPPADRCREPPHCCPELSPSPLRSIEAVPRQSPDATPRRIPDDGTPRHIPDATPRQSADATPRRSADATPRRSPEATPRRGGLGSSPAMTYLEQALEEMRLRAHAAEERAHAAEEALAKERQNAEASFRQRADDLLEQMHRADQGVIQAEATVRAREEIQQEVLREQRKGIEEERRKLEAELRDVVAQQLQLESREKGLADREEQVGRKAASIEEREVALGAREAAIDGREAKLGEREAALEAREELVEPSLSQSLSRRTSMASIPEEEEEEEEGREAEQLEEDEEDEEEEEEEESEEGAAARRLDGGGRGLCSYLPVLILGKLLVVLAALNLSALGPQTHVDSFTALLVSPQPHEHAGPLLELGRLESIVEGALALDKPLLDAPQLGASSGAIAPPFADSGLARNATSTMSDVATQVVEAALVATSPPASLSPDDLLVRRISKLWGAALVVTYFAG